MGPRSETSDRGLPTWTWVQPTSLHARSHIYMWGAANPSRRENRTHLRLHAHVVPLLLLPPATPSRSPRTRLTGEQASETPPLRILYGRGAIRFLGSDYATARFCSSTSASPSSSPCRPTPTVPPLRRPRPTRRPPRMSLLFAGQERRVFDR